MTIFIMKDHVRPHQKEMKILLRDAGYTQPNLNTLLLLSKGEILLKGKQTTSCLGRAPGNNFSLSKVFLVTELMFLKGLSLT